MVPLLFLLLAGVPPSSSLPERNVILRDVMTPTPVTDKDLRPVKLPDCRTDAEVQRQLDAMRHGETGECFIRDKTAFNRG
jgi:hypothetical protein